MGSGHSGTLAHPPPGGQVAVGGVVVVVGMADTMEVTAGVAGLRGSSRVVVVAPVG